MQDFQSVRDGIIKALLEAGHIPSGMELWAAGNIPTQQAIRRELDLCDIHIILVGAQYGSIVKGGKSFTKWEYEVSKSQGRPVIAFLLEDDEFNEGIEELKPMERESLEGLRDQLKKNAICRYFRNKKKNQNLPVDCVNSINKAINSGELPENHGWIRAGTELGGRISAVQNKFLQRILDRVYEFTTLTNRLEKEPEIKRLTGDLFWRLMLGRIRRNHYYNLFFESGSTLAYISDEFERKLEKQRIDHRSWRISTNNALTLLHLQLYTRLEVRPRPAGVPEEYYGAMFDDVLLSDPETPPTSPRVQYENEARAVQETVETLQGDKEKRLYLMTASGIDLNHDEEHFRGPHVGSHPNALFKRAIFETGQPIVMFLNDWKLDEPFNFKIGNCFPVFDRTHSWKKACRESQLAICVGYSISRTNSTDKNEKTAERDRHIETLKKSNELGNFDFDYAHEERTEGGVFIIANKPFKAIFPVE